MTKFSGLPAALIGVAIALVQPQVVFALSPAQVSEIAEKITVRIEGNNSQGSGVIIKHSGNTYYVLTCKHVVREADKYIIFTPDGESYPLDYSKVKKLQSGLDLGVVQFNSNKTYTIAKLGNSDTATRSTLVYVSGFPAPTGAIPDPISQLVDGKITAHPSKALPDGYALVYSNNTLGGMSGGPVLNENGEVIGVHGRATGLNLGIPINTFLKVSGIRVSSPRITTAPIADDSFIQGKFKLEEGNYQGAIADFDRSLSRNSNYAEAYYNRGLAYHSVGDMQKALVDWQQAASLAQQQGNRDLYQKAYNRLRALPQ